MARCLYCRRRTAVGDTHPLCRKCRRRETSDPVARKMFDTPKEGKP